MVRAGFSLCPDCSFIHAVGAPFWVQFFSGDIKMILKPNPAFVAKVVGSCSPIDLAAFAASYAASDKQRSRALCLVPVVRTYVDRTVSFRRSDHLFVRRLFHWVVQAITLAYSSLGLQPPEGLRAHSTQGLATSWGLFSGVDLQEICAAASWSLPLTFIWFYMLDASAPYVTVLRP